MVKTTGGVQDQELEIAFVHCSIAFGLGAGNIGISSDGVRALLRVYRRIITHHAQNWEAGSDRILDYAEALGRLAAHVAIGDGKLTIDSSSVSTATRNIEGIGCLATLKRRKAKRGR